MNALRIVELEGQIERRDDRIDKLESLIVTLLTMSLTKFADLDVEQLLDDHEIYFLEEEA